MNVDDFFNKFLNKEETAGRGKKQCPECKVYVGVRTHQCECGHVFSGRQPTKKERDAENDKATDEERLYAMCVHAPGGRFVYAARGQSSIRVVPGDEITLDLIYDYCNQAVFDGIQDGAIYTTSAIKLWLGHDLGHDSQEYKQACEYVDQWYNERLGKENETA